ncbi:MAG: pyruvate formate lyase family protein [Pseudomonadota bacterium]
MIHTILEYWQHLETLGAGHEDLPSPRVCRLMVEMFERWRSRHTFPERDSLSHLRNYENQLNVGPVMALPIVERRGHALSLTLDLVSNDQAMHDGLCWVSPDELIVGTMPPYSVGQGKEVMRYLKDATDDYDEALDFEARFRNEWSNFGHIVPNHEKVVHLGLNAIIEDCRGLASSKPSEASFYRAVISALEGVIRFANNYAAAAQAQAKLHEEALAADQNHPRAAIFRERIAGMTAASERLSRIPGEPCHSFTDAIQCIHIMNCALHWTGELTSIGRLDQITGPFFEKDTLEEHEAQEVIECLWVKMDERVTLHPEHIEDRFTSSDGTLLGSGGPSNFDQGSLTNQWMQQVTIGGFVANNDKVPRDGSNAVTRMCLHAARKLPFNCPTLDLRLHQDSPQDLFELAARAILSGGAHPVLMNDDKIVEHLHQRSGGDVELRSARNYACDGCYETLFQGETEFSFFFTPAIDCLERALNTGASIGAAGPIYLRGSKGGIRTPLANTFEDFTTFYETLERQIQLTLHRAYAGVLAAYGSKADICPTPILSAMIDGCVETGRDLYSGGARYKVFAPLMTGISTVADSLYVIDQLVFTESPEFSLEELVACLQTNWLEAKGGVGLRLDQKRIDEIRALCRQQPRFGYGNCDVDRYAWMLAKSFADAVESVKAHPMHQESAKQLQKRFGLADAPFELLLTPGVGTFEQYVFGGQFAGSTPDGRGAFESIASDLSPAPIHDDLEPILRSDDDDEGPAYLRTSRLYDAMASWSDLAFDRLTDGAPADLNIREDFPLEDLTAVVQAFAEGKGGNMMTLTCANPETMRSAEKSPADYSLLRVRMGGWTEFFSVLSPAHHRHHRRRPIYTP